MVGEDARVREEAVQEKGREELFFFYNQNACTSMYVQASVLVTLIRTDTTSYILEFTHATKGG